MSDYTQTTDFSAKDALASGDSNKLLKGSEFDTEFDAISTAIATKQNSSNAVTTDGAETISGDKTFSGNNTVTGEMRIDGATDNNLASFGSNAEILDSGITEAGQRVKLAETTASNDTSVDFDSVFSSTYDIYEIYFQNVVPATDGSIFAARFGASSTYVSSASSHGWVAQRSGTAEGNGSDTEIQLTGSGQTVGSDTNEELHGFIRVFSPASGSTLSHLVGEISFVSTANALQISNVSGRRLSAEANTSIQFLFLTGNVESGTITVYGIKK